MGAGTRRGVAVGTAAAAALVAWQGVTTQPGIGLAESAAAAQRTTASGPVASLSAPGSATSVGAVSLTSLSAPARTEQLANLQVGDAGPRVRGLQRRLTRLHYSVGPVDGMFGSKTRYAVWAFQKVHGLRADGIVGPETRAALNDPRAPRRLAPRGAPNRVEINLTRQLLYVYERGQLALISHISSGSQVPYCDNGNCGDAVTPTGNYTTTWRVDGWRTSDLGRLYNPVYFVGGIAVHGYPSVPRHPASHGCVRIPMHTAETFPRLVGHGEAVYVRNP